MAVFKEMDPELVRKAVEGYHDELSSEARVQSAFYRQFSCPTCKGSLVEDYGHAGRWSEDSSLPKALLRCAECGYTIAPETGVIIKAGNPALAPDEVKYGL